MLPHQRHVEIVRRLRGEGVVAVHELAAALGVTASTVRRDLARLDERGSVRRVHGGACLPDDADDDRPFEVVMRSDAPDKDAVARAAAELVADHEVVLLDIGTTAASLARRLRGRQITVAPSSLAVLDVLRDDPVVELMLLGGMVRRPYLSMVGVLTEDALAQVRADRAFLGTSGVRDDGAVLDSTSVEVPVKRAMMRAAEQVVLLADRHKFPGTGALRVCDVGDIDVLVTNEGADERSLRACARAGVEVRLS
jgi:DeoR/GlpR family transcriptional regulator of sugar metabolism